MLLRIKTSILMLSFQEGRGKGTVNLLFLSHSLAYKHWGLLLNFDFINRKLGDVRQLSYPLRSLDVLVILGHSMGNVSLAYPLKSAKLLYK